MSVPFTHVYTTSMGIGKQSLQKAHHNQRVLRSAAMFGSLQAQVPPASATHYLFVRDFSSG